jgi:hypothetical protein
MNWHSDHHVTSDALWFTSSISESSVLAIIEDLGFSKVWAAVKC